VGHRPRGTGLTRVGSPGAANGGAVRSLLRALANRDIRSLELAWTLGVAADWALLVVALLVAYDAGGPALVGLVALTRMIPATLANVFLDPSHLARPERTLVIAHLARGVGALVVAASIAIDAPWLVFPALAGASAAGALVRPTKLALLPAVAVDPADLVSANTAGALGESLGTFVGPLVAGLVVALAGPAPAAVAAAVAGAGAGLVALEVRVPDAARPPRRDRPRGIPLVTGARELVARPPAGVVMLSFLAQTTVRGALTTYLAILAIEVLDMGDPGVGVLGSAIGLGGVLGAAVAVAAGTGRRLAPLFGLSLVAWGAPIAMVGLVPVAPVALVALAVVGVGNALLDVAGFTLLQRGIDNRARGSVFAVLEVLASAGVSIGGLAASMLVQGPGIRAALVITGIALPLVAVGGWRWVRRLDAEGVVPERQAALLRGIPLFASLPLAAVERVAAGMRPAAFAEGDRLTTQGEPGDGYLVIESGAVEVSIDDRPRHREGPGQGIGEIALLRSVPRTATVTAVEPVTAWVIDSETFIAAVSGHEGSSAAARAVVAARLDRGRPGAA